eukprot:s233_g4.t1
MEGASGRLTERSSALRRPLSGGLAESLAPVVSAAELVKEMPPPSSRTTSVPQKTSRVTFSQSEAEEISADLPLGSNSLALAVMEQSKALTALVGQIANNAGDPLTELGSSSSGLSSKGSASRARLQAELAAQKGVFFKAVLQQMAKRMHPAQASDVEMSTLRDRGVTPSQYVERFGGYGRTRDLGQIQWQLALIMNFLQEDNLQAAKDAVALLFVCLEQAAMDGGNLQVGLLLSLTEEPPQSLFTGRSLANSALPRLFAPTAAQPWVTSALQYLKEMDVIATRRSEATSGKKSSPGGGGGDTQAATSSNATPKKKGKGRGRGKNQQNEQTAEEEA